MERFYTMCPTPPLRLRLGREVGAGVPRIP
jgi:hypothetical protein